MENSDLNEEIDDILTLEEQNKLNSIEIISYLPEEKTPTTVNENKTFNFWSIFDIFKNVNPTDLAGAVSAKPQTLQSIPFDFQRRVGLNKAVTINNISGKNAYLIITPEKIKSIKAIGAGAGAIGIEGNFNLEFENQGEIKAQKISIVNNSRSVYELDTSKFHCTLFLNIDGQWKKSWDNRKFNGSRFDINILEKHVLAALDKESIPNF